MNDIAVRPASGDDVAAIDACAKAAYAKYMPRMDREPAPMVADFAAHVAAGEVHVVTVGGAVAGYIVIMARPDCLFVDNVAVQPDRQGQGLGLRLMAFAEETARRSNLPRLRLYTNLAMSENLDFYGHLGFTETGRRREAGFDRVYMVKALL